MGTRHAVKNISIRCNRAAPQCEKCKAIGAECEYLPRKSRAKKQGNNNAENGLLLDILDRLKRLEKHCGLEKGRESDENGRRLVSSDTVGFVPSDESSLVSGILCHIKNPKGKAMLLSSVFNPLRATKWWFFNNERCMRAITAAMAEIEYVQTAPVNEPPASPEMSKDMAKHLVQEFYTRFQFEGHKIPLEKGFLLSIPDLLENPHVQIDYPCQIIYHTVRIRGIVLDTSSYEDSVGLLRHLHQACLALTDRWLDRIQNTPADMEAAFSMVSMALEACDSDLAWKIFGHACTIARSLGYFSVDTDPADPTEAAPANEPATSETEVEKNRKRFTFWHLIRTDHLFRLSYGKPTLIPAGSWKVNFPDPTISGVDDESSRFIQIHFLASMRLALVVMKYLDWIDSGPDPDPILHDATVDGFLEEVQSIMSDWDTDKLLLMAKTGIDKRYYADMISGSYKILIVLHQSKKYHQERCHLPQHTVDISRKSIQMFRSLLGPLLNTYWGISAILHHQLIPFFIICLDIIGNPGSGDIETDLASVTWISDYVEKVAQERAELRPVMMVFTAMASACHHVNKERLASSMAGSPLTSS
ncbi:hypothetical protein ASPZODRAFT_155485 [Penicilliopsis zonata CBS 506.65]|uniref:Xylanolytic transcriptional activator regulatory domain-containing protein n=1 Tax=Penicilliopsis zonata CBS 506.65 TaxID=1073090 RepID=A0A1L9S4Q1_9EURO|nr:hypothetical protein ASPZODRAFT_155485 [Penicilliopsis zonata CBS 506.65]OJJ42145.1 hypothetical protein ASPZODRAFT_155485 [Penicilliopsis zonata CBS 506.65]